MFIFFHNMVICFLQCFHELTWIFIFKLDSGADFRGEV